MHARFLPSLLALAAALPLTGQAASLSWSVDLNSLRMLGGGSALQFANQPGFIPWDVSTFTFAVNSLTLADQDVTFELFGPYSTLIGSRKREFEGGGGGPYNDLLIDFAYSDSSAPGQAYLGLRITGLPVGKYAMQSWHFDSFIRFVQNRIQIEIGNQSQAGVVVVDEFPLQQSPASYQFQVTQPGQIKDIIFREDGFGPNPIRDFTRRSRLNGFTLNLVPEPAATVLLAPLVPGLKPQRRRARHGR